MTSSRALAFDQESGSPDEMALIRLAKIFGVEPAALTEIEHPLRAPQHRKYYPGLALDMLQALVIDYSDRPATVAAEVAHLVNDLFFRRSPGIFRHYIDGKVENRPSFGAFTGRYDDEGSVYITSSSSHAGLCEAIESIQKLTSALRAATTVQPPSAAEKTVPHPASAGDLPESIEPLTVVLAPENAEPCDETKILVLAADDPLEKSAPLTSEPAPEEPAPANDTSVSVAVPEADVSAKSPSAEKDAVKPANLLETVARSLLGLGVGRKPAGTLKDPAVDILEDPSLTIDELVEGWTTYMEVPSAPGQPVAKPDPGSVDPK